MLARDLRPAIESKLISEFFTDPDHRKVWDYMVEHWQEYGVLPTAKTIKGNWPTYRLLRVEEPYQLCIDRVIEQRRVFLASAMAAEINAALTDEEPDVEGVLEAVAHGVSQLAIETGSSADIDLTATWEERLEEYAALKNLEGGLRGIPTGFPTIDEATAGLQDEQLVTLVALPGIGKSMIALVVAMSAQVFGKKVLFITFEMSNEEQAMRYDAALAGLSHHRLMTGQLNDREHKVLRRALAKSVALPPFYMSADREGMTVSHVRAKIEQFKPDVVLVDGVYLMQDEFGETDERKILTNMTRAFKRLAQSRKVPIFITTQALQSKYSRRTGLTIDAVGYSGSFAQDSDVLLGLDERVDTDGTKETLLRMMKARNSPKKTITMDMNWDTMEFKEISELEADWSGYESDEL